MYPVVLTEGDYNVAAIHLACMPKIELWPEFLLQIGAPLEWALLEYSVPFPIRNTVRLLGES